MSKVHNPLIPLHAIYLSCEVAGQPPRAEMVGSFTAADAILAEWRKDAPDGPFYTHPVQVKLRFTDGYEFVETYGLNRGGENGMKQPPLLDGVLEFIQTRAGMRGRGGATTVQERTEANRLLSTYHFGD